jgi:hypothetical protein
VGLHLVARAVGIRRTPAGALSVVTGHGVRPRRAGWLSWPGRFGRWARLSPLGPWADFSPSTVHSFFIIRNYFPDLNF